MEKFFFIFSLIEPWKPSEGFIHLLMVIGAFLVAGVALSIFTFYEDCYWGDKNYRAYLRDGKKRSAKT